MRLLKLTTESGEVIALTSPCVGCKGSGSNKYGGGDYSEDCPTCNATGYVLTDSAKAIEAMLADVKPQ